MVTHFKGVIAAVLAGMGASFAFAGAPASAQIYVQAPANYRAESVGYWDLDLATRAWEQALQLRINHAAERICLYDRDRAYGLSEPAYNYCYWGAWQRARPQFIGAVYRARQAAYYRAGYYNRRY